MNVSRGDSGRSQSNTDLLYYLTLRLIAHNIPGPTVGSTLPLDSIDILIQELPDTFPQNIPFPENSNLLGSLFNKHWRYIIAEFDSGLSPQQIIEFYQNSLPSERWHKHNVDHPSFKQLFLTARNNNKTLAKVFCRGNNPPSLTIGSYFHSEESSQFSLLYNYNPRDALCNIERDEAGIPFNPSVLIPSLSIPSDTYQVSETAMDRSIDSARQSITLETNLSPLAILDHYNNLLEQSPWACADYGVNEPVAAWSIWKLNYSERTWRAVLYILRVKDKPSEYLITIVVNLD